jgi:predicted GIY-YIG superfamily endonuclease
MNSGIYLIKNILDDKVYIGSSVNLKDRRYKHFWMLEKGIHDNQHL